MNQQPKAIILTHGLLRQSDSKTAHGLIRGTERYQIVAVIDPIFSGMDAGEILDGTNRGIPVLATVEKALALHPDLEYCIIGIATVGGILPADFIPVITTCIRKKVSIVNGLHDFLNEMPELVGLARQFKVQLIDIRRPKPRKELHFWSGTINSLSAPVIAVLGTDCALGKRTTCRMIRDLCRAEGINAHMIYTGQTGWLQGGQYGFIFDSTLNDFISGELENALVTCWKETGADLLLVEGQSALRNPSGPCGSEILVSGRARQVILVHAPKREYYEENPLWGRIPDLASEIELMKFYGSTVIGIALNTEHCSPEECLSFQDAFEKRLGIPVMLPLQQGVAKILPVLKSLLNQ